MLLIITKKIILMKLIEVNKFLKSGLFSLGSILSKFAAKDSKSNNDCVFALLSHVLK